MSVVCCQGEVSATGRSLVQRSPTDRDVSLCVIYIPRARGGPGPRWAVAPETKKCNKLIRRLAEIQVTNQGKVSSFLLEMP